MSLISNNLKYLRKKVSLTQEQMAAQLGTVREVVARSLRELHMPFDTSDDALLEIHRV